MIDTKASDIFSIADSFEKDHDRLDQLFRDYLQSKNSHYANARENFISFKHGLERHIAWEEEILFPIFRRKTGIIEGPVAVMEEEHRQILDIIRQINLNVENNDASSNRLEHDLIMIIGRHNIKEENVLYPVLDQLLTEIEKTDVLQQIKNFAVDGCAICCSHS